MAESPQEKAMRLVMEYERKQGRKPKDVSGDRKKGYDIESDGRMIEVKSSKWATKRNYQEISPNQKELFEKHSDKSYLYIVADIESDTPILKIFTGKEIIEKDLIVLRNYRVRLINGIWDKTKSVKLKS